MKYTDEKCDGVDMKTGLRDCWNVICKKNHTWRFYELHPQPERSKREDSNAEFLCDPENSQGNTTKHCCMSVEKAKKILEMRCSEHCGNTVRDK
jgi:hypothetical protein